MFHLGRGSDGEHEGGHRGTAEVQQTTLERKEQHRLQLRMRKRILL